MSNFLMNLLSWVLLVLVILTLFLIDKVNRLAQLQERAMVPPVQEPEFEEALGPPGDLLFTGLEGVKLWNAMTGKAVTGFSSTLIDSLRPHYEPILREHVRQTFLDGIAAAKGDDDIVVESLRVIETPRGQVNSWVPPQHLGSIFRTATDFYAQYVQAPQRLPDVWTRLQSSLDSVAKMLFQHAGLVYEVPLSEELMDVAKYETPTATPAPAPMPEVAPMMQEVPTASVIEMGQVSQGTENARTYEEQQRQDIAAESASEVIEPILPTPIEVVEVKNT